MPPDTSDCHTLPQVIVQDAKKRCKWEKSRLFPDDKEEETFAPDGTRTGTLLAERRDELELHGEQNLSKDQAMDLLSSGIFADSALDNDGMRLPEAKGKTKAKAKATSRASRALPTTPLEVAKQTMEIVLNNAAEANKFVQKLEGS
eukprot:9312109-Alexandrium_andersonii.AAC.1